MPIPEKREFLQSLFRIAVDAADPMQAVPRHLPARPSGRVIVIGGGKASARMAEALEAAWGPCEGLVVTRYGHARPCKGIEIVEAGHPVPDGNGLAASIRMLKLAESAGPDDLVVSLISGGASALLVAPAGAITLAEKQAINAALLASGAPIGEMNIVRKHLSRIKGGQLAAAAYPARVLSLMISDVPGDNPALIGSGPTVGDTSTLQQAAAILRRWNIVVPASVCDVLNGTSSVLKPDDGRLSNVVNKVIAAPVQSLEAAAVHAGKFGLEVQIIGDRIEGEARQLAMDHARQILAIQASLKRSSKPVLLLSGGELTVTRRGEGVGGPNAEYLLQLAIALQGARGIHAIACDTDGIDGSAEIAGAVIGPDTLMAGLAVGRNAQDALDSNDSHTFFGSIHSGVVTGPTLTNVNDFRAAFIEAVE